MTGYARKFDKNVTMSFKINDKKLLKNYSKIWERIESLLNIDIESTPVYGDDDKYIKTKIKIYENSIITNFHNKKIPKEKTPCKCLSIIIIDSVIKSNKSITLKHFQKNVNMYKKKQKLRTISMKTQKKVNQTATLMMRLNLILIMMNNQLKVF